MVLDAFLPEVLAFVATVEEELDHIAAVALSDEENIIVNNQTFFEDQYFIKLLKYLTRTGNVGTFCPKIPILSETLFSRLRAGRGIWDKLEQKISKSSAQGIFAGKLPWSGKKPNIFLNFF